MLEKSIKIGKLEIPHRLVMPPMATRKSQDGLVSEELIEYYARRSENPHLGLIITEHSYVDYSGRASRGQVAVDDDRCIEGLTGLAEGVHQASDARVFVQISHAGRVAETDDSLLMSADGGLFRNKEVMEMTVQDIRRIADCFASAAARVKEAGFDGVEIHGAHGYLLNQFYSPLCNHRSDEYGSQSVENRIRIYLDVIGSIREKVGKDFPISLRFGACDYAEGGSTIEDAVKAAVLFENAGVDVLSISGGLNGFMRKDPPIPYFADASEAIRKHVNIPVLLTGGMTTLEQAETALKNGQADLIGIGRALLANPYL